MAVSAKIASAPQVRPARTPLPDTLGPWRIIRLLGEGEWSLVYQATPLDAVGKSSADYAVKTLKPAWADNAQAIALLQHESLVASQVSHPHVASTLASHVTRPPRYLVFPYQNGSSLRRQLRRRSPMALAVSLWIARQVAEGLTALHEQGWVHGDVKPENVQIAWNGHATLCDLGLARSLDRPHKLTESLAGTPAYMPPEAFCEAGMLTPAYDSYSLGVMLFEMVTGEQPFTQQTAEELIAAHRLLRAPDPRARCPHLTLGVVHILQRLLAKEPLRRPSGQALIEMLVDAEIDGFNERNA